MAERYIDWLSNPDSLQVLEGFHFENLGTESRKRLEALYEMGQDRYSTKSGRKAVKSFAVDLGTSVQAVKDVIRYLENLSFTPGTPKGVDPQVYEGDQHFRGLSHPQHSG